MGPENKAGQFRQVDYLRALSFGKEEVYHYGESIEYSRRTQLGDSAGECSGKMKATDETEASICMHLDSAADFCSGIIQLYEAFSNFIMNFKV